MLAIVDGCNKFHDHIGRATTLLETALVHLPNSNVHAAPARLQRMILSIQKYAIHVSLRMAKSCLEKNTEWHWDTQQAQAFGHLKDMVTSHPTLSYFDPTKPTKISADASSHGMGAVLLQDDHPIAYASRSLTPAQKNYAQIEKEMLAIVFGCNKFHDHIYGLPTVSIETDHKPLESILRKPIQVCYPLLLHVFRG